MKYFNQIPSLLYSLDNEGIEYKDVKNILTRVRMLREVMNNSNIYYEYDMKETDNPEIIAHKMYNNPERHWIFMMGNDVQDPYYDLPLDRYTFDQYIVSKYGSFETAVTTLHHYEKKVVVTTNQGGNIETNTYTTELTEQSYVNGELTDNTLPTVGSPILLIDTSDSVDIDGVSIQSKTYHIFVSVYDYENDLNESKRTVRIPKPETISQIESEFAGLVSR